MPFTCCRACAAIPTRSSPPWRSRTCGKLRLRTDVTKVTFRHVSDEFIRAYIATGEPMDKAGAYGIQGYGAALVEKVDGDFFGVMGLPVRLVLDLLEEAGFSYDFRS